MKYFTPEDSKKLEELGLSRRGLVKTADEFGGHILLDRPHDTLDIFELPNAKKLWGEEVSNWSHIYSIPRDKSLEIELKEYIGHSMHYATLTDDEREKYVVDYLKTLDKGVV